MNITSKVNFIGPSTIHLNFRSLDILGIRKSGSSTGSASRHVLSGLDSFRCDRNHSVKSFLPHYAFASSRRLPIRPFRDSNASRGCIKFLQNFI